MLVYFSGSAREIERDIEIYRMIIKAIHEVGGIKKGSNNSYAKGINHPNMRIAFYTPEEVSSTVVNFLQEVGTS